MEEGVSDRGLEEALSIGMVVGEEFHVSVLKALSMLGLGRDRVVRITVDSQAGIRANLRSLGKSGIANLIEGCC